MCAEGGDTTKSHPTESLGAPAGTKGWDPAMDPGRSWSGVTSCDPTNPELFSPDTHFPKETLGDVSATKEPLPWGETMGTGSVGSLPQHKAQGKLSVSTALIWGSGMDLDSLRLMFLPPQTD